MKKYWLFTLFIILVTLQQNALAQTEKSSKQRKLFIGIAAGGALNELKFPAKKQAAHDMALDVQLGYQLNPKLSLLLTSNVSIYNYEGYRRNRKRDFGVLAPALQYRLKPSLWLLLGAGLGGDNPVFFDIKNPDTDPLETKYFSGFGMIGSIGYEFYRNKHMSLELKTKISYRQVKLLEGNTTGTSFALLVGVNLI
jgi:hypothetical protein